MKYSVTAILLYYKRLLFLDRLVTPAARLLERLSTLRPQDGGGTAQSSHFKILPVAVVTDEPTNGVEGAAWPGLHGGLDKILNRLVLVLGGLVRDDDSLAS